LEVSPASCHIFPVVSVSVQFPAEPFRHPSIDDEPSVEVCVVSVVVVCVVVEVVPGAVDWLGEVDEGEVD
jgi:hypothetical protein